MGNTTKSDRELYHELQLARLRSHEKHMGYIYGLRLGALLVAALAIFVGSIMTFMGLQGSFDWAVESPSSLSAKLTNASPGIVFATVGMIIGFFVVLQKPVNYRTAGNGRKNFGEITIGPAAAWSHPDQDEEDGEDIFIGRPTKR